MHLSLEAIKQIAVRRSLQKQTLRLEETEDGWLWQWRIEGVPGIISSGQTTAKTKPVAYVMALGLI